MDDITSGIIAFKQATLTSEIQYKVAAKMLDTERDNGNAILQLIDAAGKNAQQGGDALVAAATGLGGSVDTYA
jgi:polysaccharide deacetylase 2 family uncharacterized protein YibQ